jgi:hypothetical protein
MSSTSLMLRSDQRTFHGEQEAGDWAKLADIKKWLPENSQKVP